MGQSSWKKIEKCARNKLAHITSALSITYLSKLSDLSNKKWIDSRCNCADQYSAPFGFTLVALNICGFHTMKKLAMSNLASL